MSVIIEVTPTALLVENTLFTLSAALYVLAAVFHVLLLSGKRRPALLRTLYLRQAFAAYRLYRDTRHKCAASAFCRTL